MRKVKCGEIKGLSRVPPKLWPECVSVIVIFCHILRTLAVFHPQFIANYKRATSYH